MLVPQWEVLLAGIVEYVLIGWMTITTLLFLRRRFPQKSSVFKNPVQKLKDVPKFFNVKLVRGEEPEEEPVKIPLRGEGVGSETAGLEDSGVVTEKPADKLIEHLQPKFDEALKQMVEINPVETHPVTGNEEKKSAEIVEVRKPNLDTTPSKPSQLPASTTAQALPTKSKKLRELEKRRSKQ